MATSSKVIEPPVGRVRPKLKPFVPAGMTGVSHEAFVYVDEAGKLGLLSNHENDPHVELRCHAAKFSGLSDLYQAVIRYRCPGVTVGVQKPRSRCTESLLSPST